MVDQPVTREKLINADKDVQVIEDFIKKPKDETITTRFGDEIMTLKGLEEEVKKSGGYFKRYTSLAAANADIANIPVNGVVKVTDAVDGGDYEKPTAGATTLTKSAYDSLTQANGYTNQKHVEAVDKIETIAGNYTQIIGLTALKKVGYFANNDTTVILGQQVSGGGTLSKVKVYPQATVTAIHLRVFKNVGGTFVQQGTDRTITPVVGQDDYTFAPITVEKGDYLGFYPVGGRVSAERANAPYSVSYAAAGNVTSFPVGAGFTANLWDIGFTVDRNDTLTREDIDNIGSVANNTSTRTDEIEDILFADVKTAVLGKKTAVASGVQPSSDTYILWVKPSPIAGKIKKFSIYSMVAANISVGVYKLNGEGTYTQQRASPIFSLQVGTNSFDLNNGFAPLSIEQGDYIAFYASSRSLAFITGVPADDLGYRTASLSGATLTPISAVLTGSQTQISFEIQGDVSLAKIVVMTQAQYDELSVKDPNTLYGIV